MPLRLHPLVAAALIAAFLGPAKEAHPQQQEPARRSVRALQASDIFVSPDLGFVSSLSEYSPNAPLIVFIQDVHSEYEAQHNIARILDNLIQENALRLILVEGGSGDVGLAHMRAFGPPENRREVAAKYMRAGLIGGEDYTDIVREEPLVLWGVEDAVLYQRHLENYLSADAASGGAEALRRAGALLRGLVPVVFPQDLREFHEMKAAYAAGELGLEEYAAALADRAAGAGIFSGCEHLEELVRLHREGARIDAGAVKEEQAALFGRVRQSAPALYEDLARATERLKAGEITHAAFYRQLMRAAEEIEAPVSADSALAVYAGLLQAHERIDANALIEEIAGIEDRMPAALAGDAESRELAEALRGIELMEGLAARTLTPREYQALLARDAASEFARLRGLIARHSSEAAPDLTALDKALGEWREYYALAKARDEAMARRALEKLRETGEPLAVLIAGGFHAPGISRQLEQAGVNLLTIVPNAPGGLSPERYRTIMDFKRGTAALDEVLGEPLPHMASQTGNETSI